MKNKTNLKTYFKSHTALYGCIMKTKIIRDLLVKEVDSGDCREN